MNLKKPFLVSGGVQELEELQRKFTALGLKGNKDAQVSSSCTWTFLVSLFTLNASLSFSGSFSLFYSLLSHILHYMAHLALWLTLYGSLYTALHGTIWLTLCGTTRITLHGIIWLKLCGSGCVAQVRYLSPVKAKEKRSFDKQQQQGQPEEQMEYQMISTEKYLVNCFNLRAKPDFRRLGDTQCIRLLPTLTICAHSTCSAHSAHTHSTCSHSFALTLALTISMLGGTHNQHVLGGTQTEHCETELPVSAVDSDMADFQLSPVSSSALYAPLEKSKQAFAAKAGELEKLVSCLPCHYDNSTLQ